MAVDRTNRFQSKLVKRKDRGCETIDDLDRFQERADGAGRQRICTVLTRSNPRGILARSAKFEMVVLKALFTLSDLS